MVQHPASHNSSHNNDFDNIRRMFTELKTEWEQYRPIWDDISHFVGISVDSQYIDNRGQGSKSRDLDEFVDDPTSAISVNQVGDYLMGVMWGTGDNAFNLVLRHRQQFQTMQCAPSFSFQRLPLNLLRLPWLALVLIMLWAIAPRHQYQTHLKDF